MFAMRSVTSLGPRLIIPLTRLFLFLHFHFAPPRHEVRKATGRCRFGNCIVYAPHSDRCTATYGRIRTCFSGCLFLTAKQHIVRRLDASFGGRRPPHCSPTNFANQRTAEELYQCYSFISVLINKLLNYRNFL